MKSFAPLLAILLLLAAPSVRAEEATDALSLFEQGKWTEAAVAYRALVDTDPANYDAHVRYQLAHERSGADVGELRSYYDALIAKAPESVDLKLHRARLDPAADRAKALKSLASAHPTVCGVHLEQGRAFIELAKTSSALTALKKAQALATGGRQDVVLLRAQALVQKEKPADALKALDAAVRADAQFVDAWIAMARIHLTAKDADKARAASEAALLIRTRSVPALLVSAQAQSLGGDAEAALATAGAAHRLAPHLPATSTALGDYVSLAGGEGHLERAKALYEEALKIDDEFPGALQGLGWVLERQFVWDQAEKAYRTLATVRPNDPEPLNSIGWCLYKQGRVSEAQLFFRRSSDVDPKFAPALANQGMSYDAQKKFAKAIKIYEKVLKLPGQKDNLRVIINCAFDHESLGAYKKAVKLLERAHDISPEDPQIMTWLGDDWYFQKKWTKAESWYEKALAIDEKIFEAWRGLGYCLIQRKKWKQAVVALERALALNAEETEIPVVLGDIYLNELDDEEKALIAYKKYVDRGGDDEEVIALIEELEARKK